MVDYDRHILGCHSCFCQPCRCKDLSYCDECELEYITDDGECPGQGYCPWCGERAHLTVQTDDGNFCSAQCARDMDEDYRRKDKEAERIVRLIGRRDE